MNTALSILLVLAATSVHAADPQAVIGQSSELAARIAQEAYRLSPAQLTRVQSLLSEVESMLNSLPDPGVRCSSESAAARLEAWTVIRDFAYAPNGLNYGIQDAREIATTWI